MNIIINITKLITNGSKLFNINTSGVDPITSIGLTFSNPVKLFVIKLEISLMLRNIPSGMDNNVVIIIVSAK